MNYISKIIITIFLLSQISCKAQIGNSIRNGCHESKDYHNRVYQTICTSNNGDIVKQYVDTNGVKIDICAFPDYEVTLFKSKQEYIDFVKDNLVWTSHKDIEGSVFIALLVSAEGQIIDKRLIKGISSCPECTRSAMDLVEKIVPNAPAYKDGNPIVSLYTLVIPFR